MTRLTCYSDFLERVDELGFMPMGAAVAGLPFLGEEVDPASWHTGDVETDPWQWKDRAAAEKRAAYGCILGGEKGFVSARFYPIFLAACRPLEPMPERYESGVVNQTTWQLWSLFQAQTGLNTSEVRQLMKVTAKSGASRVETSLGALQAEFYITVSGVRRRVAKNGKPFGWPASVFDRVEAWAPPEWLAEVSYYEQAEARAMILDRGVEIGRGVDRAALRKLLKFGEG